MKELIAIIAMLIVTIGFTAIIVSVFLSPGLFGFAKKSDYEKLDRQKLELKNKYDQLKAETELKDTEINELQSKYEKLLDAYYILNESYGAAVEKNRELETSRLTKEIPTSADISSIEFLISQDALLIEYPELNVAAGEGDSMRPTISPGSKLIYTTQFDAQNLKIGDIVTYRADPSFSKIPVSHRIVGISSDSDGRCYEIQGDNNPVSDPGCAKPSQILNLVIGTVYGGRDISKAYFCSDGEIGTAYDGKLFCIKKMIKSGVYVTDQPLDSAVNYPFCSETDPSRPYTVVEPSGRVLCYERVR